MKAAPAARGEPALGPESCRTRYPILLLHGTGFRSLRREALYWGRIPAALEAHGARVFFGGQDAWATVEDNAAQLKGRVEAVLGETGAEKVHLIAHSKGGLEARYLVSALAMAPRVASVTTISTPHRGSRTMDALQRLPRWVFRLGGVFVNGWCRLWGDARPDFAAVCTQFTTGWAEGFNRRVPDAPGVLYRSRAGAMDTWRSDLCFWWENLVISGVEGENDGLVTTASAAWGEDFRLWRGVGGRGVSHLDEVDFRRRPLRRRGARWDPVEEYLRLAAELKERGG